MIVRSEIKLVTGNANRDLARKIAAYLGETLADCEVRAFSDGEVFVQISESQVGRCVRTRRWKYSVVAPELSGWREPASDTYTEEYLYDLEADPYELHNLIGYDAYDGLKAVLRKRLIHRMVEARETAPSITPAPTHGSGTSTPQTLLMGQSR